MQCRGTGASPRGVVSTGLDERVTLACGADQSALLHVSWVCSSIAQGPAAAYPPGLREVPGMYTAGPCTGAVRCSPSAPRTMLKISGDEMAPWRRAGERAAALPEPGEHPGLEERLHQRRHALVLGPAPHPLHDSGVRHVAGGGLDFRVQHPAIAAGALRVGPGSAGVRHPASLASIGGRPPRCG
jgi:hypothetical protein